MRREGRRDDVSREVREMVEREEGCVAVSAKEERRGVFCWDTTQP